MATKLVNGKRVELSTEEAAEFAAGWAEDDLKRQAEETARQAMAYREARKAAYVARLGVEVDVTNTIGDVLDVLIKKVRAIDTGAAEPEFDAMVAEIDRIKAENPKPQ